MEKDNLFTKIKKKVSQIPEGYVSTYGEIAKAVGIHDSRKVGWALSGNKDLNIPCHRVVNKDGLLAKNFIDQEDLLRAEDVEFVGEKRVNMKKHFFSFD